MTAPLPARFCGEPYPRRAERRLALRLARKARKAAKAERLNDARIKASLKKAGKKELAAKVALTRLASSDASTSSAPLSRKRKADDDKDDSEHVANVAYDVAETFKKRQIVSLCKMERSLEQRSSLISSNVLAALASSTAKKAVVPRGDLELKRKAFRARKALNLARTGLKVDYSTAKANGALEKALTSLMNDAVETAIMATLLDLSRRTIPSAVVSVKGNTVGASWWSDDAKTTVAGLEMAGPLSPPSPKAANEDLDAPKPRAKSIFSGSSFASTSTSILSSSSTPFSAAAAVGPAFLTQRSVTLEPTSFAVYIEASAIATLRPTTTPTFIKLSAPEVAAVDEVEQVEAAPALEPLAAVKAPRTEDDEWNEYHGWSKVYKLVKGVWVLQGKGYCHLNEAKVADEQGKKPARIFVRSGDMRRIMLNVPLFKGFDISLALRGRDWVRFSALEGSETASYLIKLDSCHESEILLCRVLNRAEVL
ncbi:hypothetical protein JCM9279_000088 [Rhodotorula babjevae]